MLAIDVNYGASRAVERAIEEAQSLGEPVTVVGATYRGYLRYFLILGGRLDRRNRLRLVANGWLNVFALVTIKAKKPVPSFRGHKAVFLGIDEARNIGVFEVPDPNGEWFLHVRKGSN